jgi:hypothetical protein
LHNLYGCGSFGYLWNQAIEESFVEFASKIEDKKQFFITKELPLEGVTCAVNEMQELLMLELEMVVMFLMYKRTKEVIKICILVYREDII